MTARPTLMTRLAASIRVFRLLGRGVRFAEIGTSSPAIKDLIRHLERKNTRPGRDAEPTIGRGVLPSSHVRRGTAT